MKKVMDSTFIWILVLFVISCATVKQAEEPVSVTASPSGVSAEAGNGRVTISWNGVSGADSYSVYMSLAPGASKKNFDARKTMASTSYSWTGLSNGTNYYFVVTAQKKDRESNDSSEVTATPSVAALPTDVSAEAGNGKVTIRWNGVSGADSYSVYMSLAPGASKKNFDARKTTASTSYSWTGLSNGTNYYFVVTAQKKDRESNDSSEVTATPKAPEPLAPKPPKEVTKAPEPPAPKPPKEVTKAPESPAPKPPKEVTKAPEPPAPKPPKEVTKAPEPPAPKPPTKETLKAPEPAPKPPEAAPKVGKLTPEELLTKADEIRAPGKNFVQDVRVILKKGNTETSNRLLTRVKGYTKSLAIFKEPPTQKDQVLLMIDNNMWMYFPKSRQPIRISPAQQLLGNVSNADVARVVYSLDYKAESVEEDTGGTDKFLKLSLKAKTEGAAYGSIKLWITRDSTKLYKAEFYTLAGRLLKTIYYKGYKQLLGRERPTLYEIHDAVKKDEVTTMEYLSMKLEDTPDNYFQRSFMDRASQL